MSEYHNPVMLDECIEGLNIQPNGTYVDVTFGGGGHSREILNHLGKEGRLLAFDQDADANQVAYLLRVDDATSEKLLTERLESNLDFIFAAFGVERPSKRK